jgi:hypothetical protein
MDTEELKLEIKSQIMEMEMDSELEHRLILSTTPWEEDMLHLTEDSTHKETETHLLLVSKTLPFLKITKVEEQLLTLQDKSQTREVETPTKLEHQLIP